MSLTVCFLYFELAVGHAVDLAMGKEYPDLSVLATDYSDSVVAADHVGYVVVIAHDDSVSATGRLFDCSVTVIAVDCVDCPEMAIDHSS